MARSSKARKLVRPTYGALVRSQLPDNVLQRVMDEEHLAQATLRARLRVLHSFAGMRSAPGREATPRYIAGAGERPSDVTHYIIAHMSDVAVGDIFSSDKLKDGYGAHLTGEPGEVVFRIVFELILQQIIKLRDKGDITYMEGSDEWWISQSVLDVQGYENFARSVVPNASGRSDFVRPGRRPVLYPRRSVVAAEIREMAGVVIS